MTAKRSTFHGEPFSRRLLLGGALLTIGLTFAGCSVGESTRSDGDFVAWPEKDRWPAKFNESPLEIQEAYRYAVSRPVVMQYIPCFCGCVAQGHTCIQDCYVAEFRSNGSVLLDPMSFG
jgi:hypothetical protein